MNVYVVTYGSYSDYHIDAIFLDEEKAKRYAKLDGDRQVEIREIMDDKIDLEKMNDMDLYVNVWGYNNDNGLSLNITEYSNGNLFDRQGFLDLYIRCKGKDVPCTQEEEKKYIKIAQDKLAECTSLRDVEGWSFEMIDEWLNKETK